IIAMIWAAAGMGLFSGENLNELLATGGPAVVDSEVATTRLGAVGGTLAIIGVMIVPITSGDTAFRGARMIIVDCFKIGQSEVSKRLMIALPMFIISIALTQIAFNLLWRYFTWANQSTAVIALYVGAMYLFISKKNYWIALIPGIFMLMATTTYILNAKIGFNLPMNISYIGAAIITVILTAAFFVAAKRAREAEIPLEEDISSYKRAYPATE